VKSIVNKRVRYRKIRDQAQQRLDQLAGEIARHQARLKELEQQLEELGQYTRSVEQLKGTLSAQQVTQRKAFAQQLLQARAHQQQQCLELHGQIAQLQKAWQQQYREMKALEKLLERTELALSRLEARQAQLEMDSFAARRSSR